MVPPTGSGGVLGRFVFRVGCGWFVRGRSPGEGRTAAGFVRYRPGGRSSRLGGGRGHVRGASAGRSVSEESGGAFGLAESVDAAPIKISGGASSSSAHDICFTRPDGGHRQDALGRICGAAWRPDRTRRRRHHRRRCAAARCPVDCVSSGRGGGAEAYRRVYLEGARNLSAAFRAARFVYTGSTSVYAQTDGSTCRRRKPGCEPDRETGRILLETEAVVLAAPRAGRSRGWPGSMGRDGPTCCGSFWRGKR